ncbi:hypothetical protein ACQ4PT_060828 [Festuca glaucescens]
MASRKLLFGLTAARRVLSRAPVLLETSTSSCHAAAAAAATKLSGGSPCALRLFSYKAFSATRPAQHAGGDAPVPSAVDHKLIMPEDKFHKLADDTIHDLLEKLEEYGDSQQMDGFDIDYGNQVLTLRLGDLGTYVVNKQTPNRQIWLSSPVSGPARFDWDAASSSWVYRRTGVNLMRLLEEEIGELCGTPVHLS